MLAIRLLAIGLVAIGLGAAPTARAGVQLYQGSWIAESFGNDRIGGTGVSEFFSQFPIPQGVNCNPDAPRCNYSSTPASTTDIMTAKNFNPLGPECVPYTEFVPLGGLTMRPDKFGTPTTGGPNARPIPPLYRNLAFFTPTFGKLADRQACLGDTTVGGGNGTRYLTFLDPLRGPAMAGNAVSGSGNADTTAPRAGGAFNFPAATAEKGMRRFTTGEFYNTFPYLYSYTYAMFSNDAGDFQAGGGFFTENAPNPTVTIQYTEFAKAVVKKGANRFGGTMRMLGKINTKACFFSLGGCFLGSGHNWRYEVIGAGGVRNQAGTVTAGKVYYYTHTYYFTAGMQLSTNYLYGSRFPWTTGSVYLTATGRGPHKTVARRKGYDNRTSPGGKGTIQLVSPILTRWITPGPTEDFETGGVAVLRIQLPEPQKWILLAAGLSLLGVLYRIRGR